jgi:hypothetical protein
VVQLVLFPITVNGSRSAAITALNDISVKFEADGPQKKSHSVGFTLYGPDITLFSADLLY